MCVGLHYSDGSTVQATLPQEDYGLVKVEENNRRNSKAGRIGIDKDVYLETPVGWLGVC